MFGVLKLFHDLRKTLGTPTSLSAVDKDVGAPEFRFA
jgi:hypothetical protein